MESTQHIAREENSSLPIEIVNRSTDLKDHGEFITIKFEDPMGRKVLIPGIFFDYEAYHEDSRFSWPAFGQVEALKGLQIVTPVGEIWENVGGGEMDIGANLLEEQLLPHYEAGRLLRDARGFRK